jgi:hypothetical protein
MMGGDDDLFGLPWSDDGSSLFCIELSQSEGRFSHVEQSPSSTLSPSPDTHVITLIKSVYHPAKAYEAFPSSHSHAPRKHYFVEPDLSPESHAKLKDFPETNPHNHISDFHPQLPPREIQRKPRLNIKSPSLSMILPHEFRKYQKFYLFQDHVAKCIIKKQQPGYKYTHKDKERIWERLPREDQEEAKKIFDDLLYRSNEQKSNE